MVDGSLPRPAATSPLLNHGIRCNDMGTQSITAYFTRFRTWIDELDNLSSIPRCSCNACTCGVSQKIELYEQGIRLSQFLMGLNDQYITIRGQLLLMNPQPTLSQAYSLLLQEENQRETTVQSIVSENAAMSVRQPFNFQRQMKSQNRKPVPLTTSDQKAANSPLTCSYCHQDKHIRDKCFFLHGYPPWHRLYGQPKPKLRNFFKQSATVAQVSTHLSSDSLSPQSTVSNFPKTSTGSTDSMMFTEAQCQQIMKLIQSGLQTIPTSSWSSNSAVSHLAGPCIEED